MVDNVKEAPARALDGVTGWYGNLRTFLGEVRNELRRVTWPSRKEVYGTTVVVILTSIFFGLYLWGLDQVFEKSVLSLFRYFGAK
ncbi:MAG TPA: preprotein translocase subunit SecE [Vicinamibacterales bacterium]|nr:preprotein translocase subunit SecE [Vicinamibacterales bacterium]HPK72895.1 preprotein translocase subunit SecE [Vicinamibacterales bacterium]